MSWVAFCILGAGVFVANRINDAANPHRYPTPTPVPLVNEPGAIKITRTELSPAHEFDGLRYKDFFIHWQNNSDVTIRALYADFIGYDTMGRINYEDRHVRIYGGQVQQVGIAPGDHFTPTDIESKPIQEWNGEVVKVQVTIVGYSG